jgi:hypothetical protein
MKPIAAFAFVPSVALNRIWFILIRWNSQRTSALRLHISAFALTVSEALQHDQPFGRRRFLESQMPRNGLNGLNGLCSEMTLLYCSRLKSSAKMKHGMWLGCIRTRYTVTYNMTMLPCISQVFFIRECKHITWQHSTTQNMISHSIRIQSHKLHHLAAMNTRSYKFLLAPHTPSKVMVTAAVRPLPPVWVSSI